MNITRRGAITVMIVLVAVAFITVSGIEAIEEPVARIVEAWIYG